MGHKFIGNFGADGSESNDAGAQKVDLGYTVPERPLVLAPEASGGSDTLSPPDPTEWYSEHFQLKDLIVTSLPFPNLPMDVESQDNLRRMAHLLDLITDNVGSFAIASCYRSPENQAALVGGAQGGTSAGMAVKNSYHSMGLACDLTPTNGMSPTEFGVSLYTDPAIHALIGQITDKSEGGGQTSIHISLQTSKFPKATLMRVGDDHQYYRLTVSEVQSLLTSFSEKLSEAASEALEAAEENPVMAAGISALTMTALAAGGFFLYQQWSKDKK